MRSEPCKGSMIELSVKIVSNFQPSTIFAKSLILNDWVLNTRLG